VKASAVDVARDNGTFALLLKETLYAGYHKHQKRSRDSNAIERRLRMAVRRFEQILAEDFMASLPDFLLRDKKYSWI